MADKFTPEEMKALAPFFTNLDADVFGLKLPQEVAGALFSRYSRSAKSLRRTFYDEFLGDPELALKDLLSGALPSGDSSAALAKARAFYDRVLVGYGDDSVAQLGAAHLACENISNVAANILEDARIGIAPLEKSTRYVRFDQKDAAGNHFFYREPKIMASRHREEYLAVMNLLFETYSRQIDPVIEFVKRSLPIDDIELRHPETGAAVSYRDAQKDEKLKKWAEGAYRSTIRTQACDILRGYLPAATLTNVGFFGVGQAFEYLLTKLYSGELAEMQELARSMHRELNQLIPSFVKRAKRSEYLSETHSATRAAAERIAGTKPSAAAGPVALVSYDERGEEKALAAILYPHTRRPLAELEKLATKLSREERERVFAEYFGRRRHRRDKPGRALERVYYTFDIVGNLGLYRDLHRHRILTQERQDFTTAHGYDTPAEVVEAGFQAEFDRAMEKAAALTEAMRADMALESQYAVPFAYKIRWTMTMNLREAVHIGELRTMPQGHPDYRFIVQEMWRKIGAVHPALARAAKFIDWKDYRLGRLQSEMRTEYKKSSF
ncbi:MAG TPA: FAD-dependent thymidylate synthase [Candidatus Binatia bacterium]